MGSNEMSAERKQLDAILKKCTYIAEKYDQQYRSLSTSLSSSLTSTLEESVDRSMKSQISDLDKKIMIVGEHLYKINAKLYKPLWKRIGMTLGLAFLSASTARYWMDKIEPRSTYITLPCQESTLNQVPEPPIIVRTPDGHYEVAHVRKQ